MEVNKNKLTVKDAKIESLKKQLKEQEKISEAVKTKHQQDVSIRI